jgi:AraC-like DNA-binding protein
MIFSGVAPMRTRGMKATEANWSGRIAREIWLHLAQAWARGGGDGLSPRVREMVRFLRERLTERVTRRQIAREFRLTPEYVNALFRKEMGITPTQFIHRERVLRAYRLLEEGASVEETARKVGFRDRAYFSKIFKKVMNISPSEVA